MWIKPWWKKKLLVVVKQGRGRLRKDGSRSEGRWRWSVYADRDGECLAVDEPRGSSNMWAAVDAARRLFGPAYELDFVDRDWEPLF